MTDYDPNTEVGPEVSPGIRLVDDRIAIEIREIYDGVSIWAYPDERALINRWTGTEFEGSTRWRLTEEWIAKHGDRALNDLYPHRKKETEDARDQD